MLSSLYDDTSSETSQVNTPKRGTKRNHVIMSTPRASGMKQGKVPFKSPYLTPLRSSAKKNPIVEQVHATMDLCIRIFTSNILFIGTLVLIPVFLGLLFTRAYPYINSEKCDIKSQYRIRYFCLNNYNNTGNLSKTVTRIVKQQRPSTFDELYDLLYFEEKVNITRDVLRNSLQYCDEVACFNGNIYYKLSDSAEIFILSILSILALGLFLTCCIFKYRRHFSYQKNK